MNPEINKAAADDFRASLLWQKAHQFVLSVYNYSEYFPQKETCGLTVQLRRGAIAIALNVGEAVRRGNNEKAKAIATARGLVEECRYYLILAKDLGYGDHPELMPQLEEVNRMLEQYGLELQSLEL